MIDQQEEMDDVVTLHIRQCLGSLLVRLENPHRPHMWAWTTVSKLASLPTDAIEKQELIPLPEDQVFFSMLLFSQMRPCFYIEQDGVSQYYAMSADIQALAQCPVFLASHIERENDILSTELSHPIPPPEHGTGALIIPALTPYSITDLPARAQDLQRQLSQRLTELFQEIPAVHLAFSEEVRAMIQQLAQEYHMHHLKTTSTTRDFACRAGVQDAPPAEQGALFPALNQEAPAKPQKSPRPHTPTLFDAQGYAPLPTSQPMQALINALHNARAGADRWVFDEEKARKALEENQPCPVPYYRHLRDIGQTTLTYRDGESTQVDARAALTLWQRVKTMHPRVIDIVLDTFGHLSRNMEDGAAWFFASEHLDHRGATPITKRNEGGRRAGHRKEDMEEIHQALASLQALWITIEQKIETDEQMPKKKGTTGKPRRKKRVYTHTGRVLIIDEMWYQNELTGEEGTNPFPTNSMPIGWHIRAGEWLRTFLEAPNRQVARLCQALLHYDPYHEHWEKNIGLYLLFHGHMQLKGKAGKLTRVIQDIMDEVSLPRDTENPQRTRTRFEKAMNRLEEDGLIDGWEYSTENAALPHKQWLTRWLTWTIHVYIAPGREQLQEG